MKKILYIFLLIIGFTAYGAVRVVYDTDVEIMGSSPIEGNNQYELLFRGFHIRGEEEYFTGKIITKGITKDNIGEMYIKDGKPHGKTIQYYENGNLKEKGRFKNGRMHGKILIYHENGQIESEATYKNGIPIGEVKCYDSSGKLVTKIRFKNGVLVEEVSHK